MKGAHLWKRILNEGFDVPDRTLRDDDNDLRRVGDYMRSAGFVRDIITAKIIVCDIKLDESEHAQYDLRKTGRTPMPLPFHQFWVEFPEVTDWTCGNYVSVIKSPNEDFSYSGFVFPIIGVREKRPFCRQPVFIAFDADMRIHGLSIPQIEVPGYGLMEDCHAINHAGFLSVALHLLACKNVSLKGNDGEPKQARRASKRYGNTPDAYRYHTLTVRASGGTSGAGIDIGTMPHHVCMGHFSYYGPASSSGAPDGLDRGLLFGKHTGKFYMPPCLKGDKKNGVVEKDYLIPAGTDSSQVLQSASPS